MSDIIRGDDEPKCGCRPWDSYTHHDSACLYADLVAIHAKSESQLRDARELLQRALLTSAWMGTDSLAGEIESYLNKEKP